MGAPQIAPHKLEINNALVEKMHNSVQKTFDGMFDIMPTPGKYRVETDYKNSADISGVMGLTQERIEGSLIVSFPKATIFKMLAKIYNQEFTDINKSVSEGVAEIVNVIFGVTKAQLNSAGFSFMQSLPSLVLGDQHSVALVNRPGGKTLVIPFTSPCGPFQVLVQVHPDDLLNVKS